MSHFDLCLPFHSYTWTSNMLLVMVPDGFMFAPKRKSNDYNRAENG